MKKQNPKKPAAKPAKTPKPPAGAADALALTPDGIRAALRAWKDAPPVALPTPPPALDEAVRSLLVAARLDPPGSAVPEGLAGCFVRLLDEWELQAAAALAAVREAEADARAALAARGENPDALLTHVGPDEWSWQALEEVAFSRDWRSYRLAQVARLSRETIRRAVAALGGLSPDAARAAAQRSQARFALAGTEMMWYRGTQLPPPGADFDEAGEQRRELLEAAVRRALDELDGAARACAAPPTANPAPPPEPPPAKTKRSKGPGKHLAVSLKETAGKLGRTARTLQRYEANPGRVPDELRGYCRAVRESWATFNEWLAGLGMHEGNQSMLRDAAEKLGGDIRGMRVGRRP